MTTFISKTPLISGYMKAKGNYFYLLWRLDGNSDFHSLFLVNRHSCGLEAKLMEMGEYGKDQRSNTSEKIPMSHGNTFKNQSDFYCAIVT